MLHPSAPPIPPQRAAPRGMRTLCLIAAAAGARADGNYSLVPNANCTARVQMCYQGALADVTTVSTSDPVFFCKGDKSDIVEGACADHGYGDLFLNPDPVYRGTTVWKQSAPTHDEYARRFAKSYGAGEKARRAAIYAANVALIRQHNADPSATWTAGVNEFTDWTNDEFRAQRVMKGARPPAPLAAAPASGRSVRDLPAAVDWRNKTGVLTGVKDQKSCGSCWAFAAVETFESQVAIVSGAAAPVLSEQQVVDCAPNPDQCGGTGGCQGSTQQLAFNYTSTVGLATEDAYAYTGKDGDCKKPTTVAATNTGYVTVKSNDYTAHVDALANVGPLAITVAAGGLGWQLYKGGIMKGGSGLMGCNANLDHGVQLVGFGSEDGVDYWIVRNSWGPSWGENGFIRLQRFGEGNEPCQVDKKPADGIACKGDTEQKTYCGTCALLSSSSYPTGVKAA